MLGALVSGCVCQVKGLIGNALHLQGRLRSPDGRWTASGVRSRSQGAARAQPGRSSHVLAGRRGWSAAHTNIHARA